MRNNFLTREQYISQQRQSIIDKSIENSNNRILPTTPYVINLQSKEDWENEILNELKVKEDKLKQFPQHLLSDEERETKATIENIIIELKNELSNGYKSCVPGATCIYTATDNYGKKYRVSGNKTFRANPAKYGFEEINLNDIRPGDIIQDFGPNGPRHTITFVGYDDTNKATFNYSKGGSDESEIVKNGYYPFEWDDMEPTVHLDGINNRKLQHAAAAYRFIGTKEDNELWNNQYNIERQKYAKKVLEELKSIKPIELSNKAVVMKENKIKKYGGKNQTNISKFGGKLLTKRK
jgi:hypothetical protein